MGEVQASPGEHLGACVDPQPLSGILRGFHGADVEDADLGRSTGLRGLGEIGSFATLPKRAPETFRGSVLHRRTVLDDRTLAVPGLDQTERTSAESVAVERLTQEQITERSACWTPLTELARTCEVMTAVD